MWAVPFRYDGWRTGPEDTWWSVHLEPVRAYAGLMTMAIRGPVTEQWRGDLERIQRSQQHLLGLVTEVRSYP